MTEEIQKKVSIIIPVYNAENYLARCIDSILNQSYENLEIILVDDGSTDDSGNICDEYKNEDNRIIVLHQKNMGQAEARNNAIQKATGEYYVFVDADDEAPEYMVENLLLNCLKNDSEICIGEYIAFTDSNDYSDKKYIDSNPELYCGYKLLPVMHSYPGEKYVVLWGKIFKADLFKNIKFPKGRIGEDLAVLYKLYDKSERIVLIDHVVYKYFRGNESSSTYSLSERYFKDVYTALDEEIEYLNQRHPELICYPYKTYMYWLFYEYRKLFNSKKDRKYRSKIYRKYCFFYDKNKKLAKEKFYTAFRYFPKLYCFIKG